MNHNTLGDELSEPISRQTSHNSQKAILRTRISDIFRKIFEDTPDDGLLSHLTDVSVYFTEEELESLLQSQIRFNESPVHMTTKDGTQTVDHCFRLRAVLREAGPYFLAAKHTDIGLENAVKLLIHTINATPYDFHFINHDIKLLGRLFRICHEKGIPLINHGDLLSNFIATSSKYGVSESAIFSLGNALVAGMDIETASKLILTFPENDGHMSGYGMPYLLDFLRAIRIAHIDPKNIKVVFDTLLGDCPTYKKGHLATLQDAITFLCPSENISPNAFFEKLRAHLESGGDMNSFSLPKHIESTSGERGGKILAPEEDYFVETKGPLTNEAIPYRNKQSFEEGIKNLVKIARNNPHNWDESPEEGCWAFDPESKTWYSLGGKTKFLGDRIRHEFMPYNFSLLSKNPIWVHVHPEHYESAVGGMSQHNIRNPSLIYKYRKIISATPSRADFKMILDTIEKSLSEIQLEAIIVHSLGYTKIHFPHDKELLQKMSERARDIRDRLFLELETGEYYKYYADSESESAFVARWIKKFNSLLPKGISLEFIPLL